MCAPKLLQSCLTLCNPEDHSPPGSSVRGILPARILDWVAMPSSRDLPGPGIEPTSLISALAGSSNSVIPYGGKQIGVFIHQLLSIRN